MELNILIDEINNIKFDIQEIKKTLKISTLLKPEKDEPKWIKGSEHMREYFRNYYHEKVKTKANNEYKCNICGGKCITSKKARHERTKKHLKALLDKSD